MKLSLLSLSVAMASATIANGGRAVNSGVTGVPLPQPEVLRSENGLLDTTLEVVVSRLDGPISFTRRSFNGQPTGYPSNTFTHLILHTFTHLCLQAHLACEAGGHTTYSC